MHIKLVLRGIAVTVAVWALPVQAAPPPLSTYGNLPGLERAAISASGDHVAILASVDGAKHLIMADAAQKIVRQINFGDLNIGEILWAGDQSVLVHYSQTVALGIGFTAEKAALKGVMVVPLDGTAAWKIFGDEKLITGGVRNTYGVINHNGRWYGYFGGITLTRGMKEAEAHLVGNTLSDLYEVDLQDRKTRLVARKADMDDNSVNREWMVNASGAVGATMDYDHRTGIWSIRNAADTIIVSGREMLGNIRMIGFTADNTSIIYHIRDNNDGQDRWFSLLLAGGTPQPFLADAVKSENRAWRDRGHHLIGYEADDKSGESHFFDPYQDKAYKAVGRAFPGLRMTVVNTSDAFDHLLVTTEGPGDPVTWWTVNIHTGKADVIGSSYALAAKDVGPMRMLPYKAADGLAMEGVLTLPPGREAKALPAIVLPHDGPAERDVAGFDWLAQAFASRGYAVFQPNFRGSAGYGTVFRFAGAWAMGPQDAI